LRAELAEVTFTPIAEALARLERAVSPLVGIVSTVVRTTYAPDDARLAHWACAVNPAGRTLGSRAVDYGGGSHADGERARAAALGEAVERYAAAYVPTERLVLTTAGELGGAAVDPTRFALFHPRQLAAPGFPFEPYTASTLLHFVDGFSLTDGSTAFLPAQLVYLGPTPHGGARIGYPTSSGLACGATFDEAVLAGLLELVERDAVMIAWAGRLSLPLLDWHGDAELVELEQRYFSPSRLRYSVLDGSGFLGVPVAIAVLHGADGQRTALSLGGGCAPSVGEAWAKALAEAFSVHRWLSTKAAQQPGLRPPEPQHISSFDDHMLFYADPANADLAAFLDASPARTPVPAVPAIDAATPRAALDDVLARLARQGISAYAVDVTSPDVAELGLHVARVVAPELCPLDVLQAARYLGGPRLYHAAHGAGLAAAPLRFDDVNPHPHPFP
jgi:ribosomal protein S12 methylthiotransferase accessory factor